MQSKVSYLWNLLLCSLVLLLSLPVHSAVADSDSWAPLRIELSDTVIGVDQKEPKITVTIRGKGLASYSLASSASSTLFSLTSDERAELASSAQIITSGKLDRNGRAVFTIPVPSSPSGRVYLQVASSKQITLPFWPDRRIYRDADLSSVVSVILLSEILKSVTVSSIPGPKGDIGPQGIQGPAGPQGVPGTVGAVGPQGPAGDIGPIGPVGSAGATGQQGAPGDVGPQGVKGDRGDQGAPGPQGAVGPQGIPGEIGPTGLQGIAGPKGDKGDTGLTGDEGPQGIQGMTGPAGAAGPAGAVGQVGAQGAQGEKGDIGPTGPAGSPGATGASGPRGEKGDTGGNGAQGLPGTTGATGPQGVTGTQGPAGPAGPQGPTGPTPQMTCPAGWVDIGPTCIEANFNASATIDQAIQSCFLKGARVCEHQELSFACMNRANLGINFPDSQWLHTGSIMLRSLSGSSTNNFVGYAVYRRVANRCFGPSTINPADAVIGYDLADTSRNFACCAGRSF